VKENLIMNPTKVDRFAQWGLILLFVLGAFLRCWHWSTQILLDDEWHALNFVVNRTLLDVFLQQGLGANSIPVNIYAWIVLHTTGWSEPLLRLPSLVAGVFALVILPLLIKRIWGTSVACISAALLAVSPVLIFYSRIMRPYAPAMLLATSSVLLTLIWCKEGKRRDLLLSALCGSLAIYFHLYTAIPVGVPLLVACAAALKPFGQRLGLELESKSPVVDILIASGIMAIICGILVVVPNVINPWWSHGIHGMDHANRETAVTVLSLIAGTRNPALMAIVLGLFLTGMVVIILRSRITGVALVLSFSLFSFAMANTTQDGAHAGIQVARYGLTFFPLSFVAIAVALVWIGECFREKCRFFQRRYLLVPVAMVVWCPYLATSPLWTTYTSPNNFTNHSAYQYRYDPIQWQQRSPERDLVPGISMDYRNIPPLYMRSPLIASAKGIIEYPVLIGDQLNLYYYYQHFHRQRVVAGYVSDNRYVPVTPGSDFVIGDWPFDSVMSAVPESLGKKSSWRTMVDLNDSDALRSRYRGWIILIHRDPLGEIFGRTSSDNQMSLKMVDVMTSTFGPPRLLDEQIAAWTIE
jgi:hypothetical protein